MLQSDRCLNCVTKSLNLFKKLTTAFCKFLIVKDLDCAGFGLCKIWFVLDLDRARLDCARFGSRNIKIVQIWFEQNLDCV